MNCPFEPYIQGGKVMVGVSRCTACGAFTNSDPEAGRYRCKGTSNPCIEEAVKAIGVVKVTLAPPPKPKQLWGDMLAKKLDSIGITKDRWTEGLVALGLTTYEEGCNCADRQRKLNELGEKVMGWLGRN